MGTRHDILYKYTDSHQPNETETKRGENIEFTEATSLSSFKCWNIDCNTDYNNLSLFPFWLLSLPVPFVLCLTNYHYYHYYHHCMEHGTKAFQISVSHCKRYRSKIDCIIRCVRWYVWIYYSYWNVPLVDFMTQKAIHSECDCSYKNNRTSNNRTPINVCWNHMKNATSFDVL